MPLMEGIGCQTEVWSMEKYLEELDTLKRRKWITDKENRDLLIKVNALKEQLKKAKEESRRLFKKTNEMKDRDNNISKMLGEKDKLYKELKDELDAKIKEIEKDNNMKAKQITNLQV